MNSVAIVGGGITGLTAAFRLQQRGIPITLYEAGDRVGGAIRSVSIDGYLAEFGPNTILETSPKVASLVNDVGLAGRRIYSDPAANNRYLGRDRQIVKMPGSLLEFVRTPLFSTAAKLRLLLEPLMPRAETAHEESIAAFVQRRLGAEFLDRAVDALVGGIYAGDPQKLSVSQAFPKLHALEQKYGSLILGQIFGARERKRRGEVAKPDAKKFSFDAGLQVLPNTLAAKLGNNVRMRTPVMRLTQSDDGWLVATNSGLVRHSAVVLAGTALSLARIDIDARREVDLSPLARVVYPPVASVVFGFRRKDVAHPLDGFGMLIPRREGFHILGTIFSSSLFPNRAPADCVLLTSYVGGVRSSDLAKKSADELFELTCPDLRELLGISGLPTFRHYAFFPQAIAQYDIGYGRIKKLLSRAEMNAPGLFFAGHYRDGISVSDCIVSAENAAARATVYAMKMDGAARCLAATRAETAA